METIIGNLYQHQEQIKAETIEFKEINRKDWGIADL